jgi:hypothetical protein
MDPDQPGHPRSLIRIHAVRLPTLLQVQKLTANSMDPDHSILIYTWWLLFMFLSNNYFYWWVMFFSTKSLAFTLICIVCVNHTNWPFSCIKWLVHKIKQCCFFLFDIEWLKNSLYIITKNIKCSAQYVSSNRLTLQRILGYASHICMGIDHKQVPEKRTWSDVFRLPYCQSVNV